MKDILEYTSDRQYIADYYADRKAKSAFTWQDFTRAAGFSSPVQIVCPDGCVMFRLTATPLGNTNFHKGGFWKQD